MKIHRSIRGFASLVALVALAGALAAFPESGKAATVPTSQKAPVIEYSKLTGEAITKGCQAGIAESDAILAEMVKVPTASRNFDNTMMPLNRVEDLLGQTFGRYAFMSYVSHRQGTAGRGA